MESSCDDAPTQQQVYDTISHNVACVGDAGDEALHASIADYLKAVPLDVIVSVITRLTRELHDTRSQAATQATPPNVALQAAFARREEDAPDGSSLRRFVALQPMSSVSFLDSAAPDERPSLAGTEGLLTAPQSAAAFAASTFNASVATTLNRSAVVVTRGETLDSVNDFEFIHQIGHGAQATVWLCVDVRTGEERAVKVIDRSNCADADAESGLVEIEAAMRLQHDNVIRLYEVIDDPSAQAVFLVMEYVEDGASGTVSESGECATRYSVAQVTELAAGAALGLQYCHDRGVVHGDIKPENLLVSTDEETRTLRAVLADFGVAKLADACAASMRSSCVHSAQATQPDGLKAASHIGGADSGEKFLMSRSDEEGPVLPIPPLVDRPVGIPPRPAVGTRRISLVTPDVTAPPSVSRIASLLHPHPPSSALATVSFTRNLSLREVGRLLADKTRSLVRILSDDEKLRSNFAKRGPRTFGGTPAFQAPELLEGGQPTPASDMWALGVTLYALIFKQLPWNAATWFDLKAEVCGKPALFPVSTVSDRECRRWRVILERLLDRNPTTRMTAEEFLHASLALARFMSNNSAFVEH